MVWLIFFFFSLFLDKGVKGLTILLKKSQNYGSDKKSLPKFCLIFSSSLLFLNWDAAPINCITWEPELGARCRGEGCIKGAPSCEESRRRSRSRTGAKADRREKKQEQGHGQGQRQEASRGKIAGVLINQEHDHNLEQQQELKQE